jgi:hypothetical protein
MQHTLQRPSQVTNVTPDDTVLLRLQGLNSTINVSVRQVQYWTYAPVLLLKLLQHPGSNSNSSSSSLKAKQNTLDTHTCYKGQINQHKDWQPPKVASGAAHACPAAAAKAVQ